jgi:prepilin-type processing-associated H-X9-DG protein
MVKLLNRYKARHGDASVFGISRVGVLTVLACIVGVILLVLLPALNRARDMARLTACESNLKLIGIASRTWENNYNDLYPMGYYTNADGSAKYADGSNVFRYFQVMSNAMSNEWYTPRVLTCPSDVRHPAADFAHLKNDNVSYFVGLDADETVPAMLLAGDRNLVTNGVDVVPGLVIIGTNIAAEWSSQMHNGVGNVVMADGSVSVQKSLANTGTNVDRLAVP